MYGVDSSSSSVDIGPGTDDIVCEDVLSFDVCKNTCDDKKVKL